MKVAPGAACPISPADPEEERPQMTTPGSPTVRRRRLAAELRAIRESTGKSGDVVANALKWSPSKISRYELARTGLKLQEVEKLLDYYQVGGTRRERLLDLAKDAAQRGWWEDYADGLSSDYQEFIGLEHEATSMAIWHVEVVAGLFQTEAYARHIIGSYAKVEPIPPSMVERLVKVRMQRQRLVTRESIVQLSVVLDESILHRRIGSDQVMHDQLMRLLHDADRPNVTLRVLPLEAQHTVFAESFVIFRFGPDDDAIFKDVVSSEHLKSADSLEGEQETYLHRIVFDMLLDAALDPQSSKDLIRDVAASNWSSEKCSRLARSMVGCFRSQSQPDAPDRRAA
ncbi:MAG TPA: helix-turn-helix transcriptional regulator [Streptosporangiaceae bacterium]|nr:helix-turn-helix transcriptional regulator [Streptosporangiaceae bacterium]